MRSCGDYIVNVKKRFFFDFHKSKEFFSSVYEKEEEEENSMVNSEIKSSAFFWLCWAESLFRLANYEGVYLAISQAKKRQSQPYDVVQEYIHEYFPRKCRHLSEHLKLGIGNEEGNSFTLSRSFCSPIL